MKKNLREILRPALILTLICFVVTVCLAVINAVTKNAIAAQKERDAAESRKAALPGAETFEKSKDGELCYLGKKGGQLIGYVMTTKANSYGGKIEVITGIDKSGKITGVILTSTSDTPGLGLNAKNDAFRNQYRQQVPEKGFGVVKGAAGQGQISALTGATITSKAVTKAVNEAVAEYQKVKEGG